MALTLTFDERTELECRVRSLKIRGAAPGQKPYCNRYGFEIDNYDHEKVGRS
jgi:hypothetical protein